MGRRLARPTGRPTRARSTPSRSSMTTPASRSASPPARPSGGRWFGPSWSAASATTTTTSGPTRPSATPCRASATPPAPAASRRLPPVVCRPSSIARRLPPRRPDPQGPALGDGQLPRPLPVRRARPRRRAGRGPTDRRRRGLRRGVLLPTGRHHRPAQRPGGVTQVPARPSRWSPVCTPRGEGSTNGVLGGGFHEGVRRWRAGGCRRRGGAGSGGRPYRRSRRRGWP